MLYHIFKNEEGQKVFMGIGGSKTVFVVGFVFCFLRAFGHGAIFPPQNRDQSYFRAAIRLGKDKAGAWGNRGHHSGKYR